MSAPGPQVGHPAETASAAGATRSLIDALRTADAPADVLERVTALVGEATELLAPHHVDGTPGQTALRASLTGAEQFETAEPGRFFPYSPVVGPLNPIAPPLTFTFEGERLRGTGALPTAFVGPPGTVHGGVVAMVLDELLGAVNACLGLGAFTGTLTIRYERPTPIATDLEMESWVERTEGRKVFTVGAISAGGEVTRARKGCSSASIRAHCRSGDRGDRSGIPDLTDAHGPVQPPPAADARPPRRGDVRQLRGSARAVRARQRPRGVAGRPVVLAAPHGNRALRSVVDPDQSTPKHPNRYCLAGAAVEDGAVAHQTCD